MKREFSAGGIVFNDQGQVLVTQHSSNKHWGFPKGHIEPGETSQEAALREVEEEAGVKAQIGEKVGENKYIYTGKDDAKIFKVVTLYLMKYISGEISNHNWEVSEARWVKPEEALQTLSFDSDKKLLKQALNSPS